MVPEEDLPAGDLGGVTVLPPTLSGEMQQLLGWRDSSTGNRNFATNVGGGKRIEENSEGAKCHEEG